MRLRSFHKTFATEIRLTEGSTVAKLPSFQFYPGDWMKDPALRACSLAARGLWLDLLCLMFECDRRGYLQINGKPMSLEQIARATGCSTDEASRGLQELESSGVFSRSEHGSIYSRRLVRDDQTRAARSEAGSIGGSKTQANRKANAKQKSSSSSSTSSSVSTSVLKTPLPPLLQKPEFEAAWKDWEQHRKETKHPLKPTMAVAQLKMLADMGHDRAIACIRHTIAMGWQGLREEEHKPAASNGKPWTPPKLGGTQ